MKFEFQKFNSQHEKLFHGQSSSVPLADFFNFKQKAQASVHRFVIFDHKRPLGLIQIYSATQEGNGYWHTQELGNFGVDLFVAQEVDQKPEMIKAIFDSFLTQLFKARSLEEVTSHPQGDELDHLTLFFGADYRIEELMMMKEGGALLLEVFWI